MSLRDRYDSKYKPILTSEVFAGIGSVELIDKHEKDLSPFPSDWRNIDELVTANSNRTLRFYFIFCNGFIGKDFFILLNTAYNLLLYNSITVNEYNRF